MLRFNENNEVIRQDEYKAILVGLQRDREEDISYSMEELKGLAEAANAEVLGMMTQNLERPNTATLIGKGKVEELAELVKNMEADTVIFNDELSGMQLRNLEDALDVRVIDRTILILDIFADRASSREGKLQVELAQLQYRMPRLIGFGKSLSRLGGGIGTRGPGEKKLETDRRHIEKRMLDIKAELDQIKNTRSVQRARREKNEVPVVALVGYTNSGKSALMNRILAFNKIDLVDSETVIPRPGTENIFISAKHDIHVDELLDMIRSKIFSDEVTCCMMIPYTRGDITSYLCDKAEVAVMDYQADGTYFKLTLKNADYQKYKEYEIDEII